MTFYNRVVNIVGKVDGFDEREQAGLHSCFSTKFSTPSDSVNSPIACGRVVDFEVNLPANYPGGAKRVDVYVYQDTGSGIFRSVAHSTVLP